MPRTDTASRIITEPSERVYAALVDADALASWLPPEGMSGTIEEFDVRPGGGYRMTLTHLNAPEVRGKTTADTDVITARFLAIAPGQRVVQAINFTSDDPAFAGTMTMTWEVESLDGELQHADGHKTRVTIRAEDVPDGISAAEHAVGLASSLANLAAYLATEDPEPHQLGTSAH